jgi:hypothetical protein
MMIWVVLVIQLMATSYCSLQKKVQKVQKDLELLSLSSLNDGSIHAEKSLGSKVQDPELYTFLSDLSTKDDKILEICKGDGKKYISLALRALRYRLDGEEYEHLFQYSYPTVEIDMFVKSFRRLETSSHQTALAMLVLGGAYGRDNRKITSWFSMLKVLEVLSGEDREDEKKEGDKEDGNGEEGDEEVGDVDFATNWKSSSRHTQGAARILAEKLFKSTNEDRKYPKDEEYSAEFLLTEIENAKQMWSFFLVNVHPLIAMLQYMGLQAKVIDDIIFTPDYHQQLKLVRKQWEKEPSLIRTQFGDYFTGQPAKKYIFATLATENCAQRYRDSIATLSRMSELVQNSNLVSGNAGKKKKARDDSFVSAAGRKEKKGKGKGKGKGKEGREKKGEKEKKWKKTKAWGKFTKLTGRRGHNEKAATGL